MRFKKARILLRLNPDLLSRATKKKLRKKFKKLRDRQVAAVEAVALVPSLRKKLI